MDYRKVVRGFYLLQEMEFTSHAIKVTKTARYLQVGSLNETATEVWIVLHGYAQLVTDFIQLFECIAAPHRVIIAPEGLNRFYAKGFGGKPAATWMTSEEREAEIADYIAYLNQVYRQCGLESFNGQIRLLGFSQGVATASRWAAATSLRIDDLIVYAGELAAELTNPLAPQLARYPITYVTGTNDPMISAEKAEAIKEWMFAHQAKLIVFNGGHQVVPEALMQLI